MAYAPNYSEDYFQQQLDSILANPDKAQAASDLNRLQRLGDYMQAQMLPAHARAAAEQRINGSPQFQGASWQAQGQLANTQALHPAASARVVDANFVDPWQLAGQFQQNPGPVQAITPMRGAQAAHVPTAMSAMSALPAVGVGSFQGQTAFYPRAGQVPAYQDQMQRMGLNPDAINMPPEGRTLQDYMQAMQERENQAALARGMTDAKVLAAKEKAMGQIGAAKEAGQSRILSTQIRADGLYDAHVVDADGRERVAVLNNQGQEVREGMRQAGIDRRTNQLEQGRTQRANDRNQNATNNALIRAGKEPLAQGGGGQGLFGMMQRVAGLLPAGPDPAPTMSMGDTSAAPRYPSMPQHSYAPKVQALIDKAPEYVAAKLKRVSADNWAKFQQLPPDQQEQVLRNLYAGRH